MKKIVIYYISVVFAVILIFIINMNYKKISKYVDPFLKFKFNQVKNISENQMKGEGTYIDLPQHIINDKKRILGKVIDISQIEFANITSPYKYLWVIHESGCESCIEKAVLLIKNLGEYDVYNIVYLCDSGVKNIPSNNPNIIICSEVDSFLNTIKYVSTPVIFKIDFNSNIVTDVFFPGIDSEIYFEHFITNYPYE
jgi:hypothetical protein